MLRLISFVSIITFFLACAPSSANDSRQVTGKEQEGLDGVYEFVSETTTKSYPVHAVEKRDSSEWRGLWLFHRGYFSKTFVKIDRSGWTPGKFPADARGTGFDGVSGTYAEDNGELNLSYSLSFYPIKQGEQETYTIQPDNGSLTLRRTFAPIRESMTAGEQVIVLRKIR